ncbi:hypothetical protein ISS04_02715 [Candidatus Woesearchaeota archaeon]|nr:hypothetical protein [Candidatus Woesearchaeota archaeon]
MTKDNQDLEVKIFKDTYGYRITAIKQELNGCSNYYGISKRIEYDLNFSTEKPIEVISKLREKSCKTNTNCYCRLTIAEKLENFIKENKYS